MYAFKKLIRTIHLTETALAPRLRIAEIAPSHFDVLGHVRTARLALGREESLKLIVGAVGGRLTQSNGHEARDEVGEGIDAIHEDPEAGEVIARRQDTTESVHHNRHERSECAGDFLAGRAGDEEMGEGGCEDENGHDDEEGVEATDVDSVRGLGVAVETCWVVPD